MIYLAHTFYVNVPGLRNFTSLAQGCVMVAERQWHTEGNWQGYQHLFMVVGRFLNSMEFRAVGWGQPLVIPGITHLHNKNRGMQ